MMMNLIQSNMCNFFMFGFDDLGFEFDVWMVKFAMGVSPCPMFNSLCIQSVEYNICKNLQDFS